MPRLRYKFIFALIFSPMLANTSVAEVIVETVAQKVEKIKTAEAAATETTTEMSVTEKVLNKIETLTDNFKAESDKPSATVLPETAQTNNPVNKLKSVEKFKICSLGNNYNISNYEFTKEQQIDQATTLITYKAQEESRYNCEVEVISENSQDVSLKCWKGCLLYTSPSPRDQRGSRMPSSA